MIVQFKNVGRDKKTWTEDLAGLSHYALRKAVERKNALRSRNIDFAMNENGEGFIFAGFRQVGTFDVPELKLDDSPSPQPSL